jgi:alanine dehydrogenase
MKLARLGALPAIVDDAGIAEGVNTLAGFCTYRAVANAQDREYTPVHQVHP